MEYMLNFTYGLCQFAGKTHLIPAATVIASLNMLVQILFSVCFGSKGLPKIRGYRGE